MGLKDHVRRSADLLIGLGLQTGRGKLQPYHPASPQFPWLIVLRIRTSLMETKRSVYGEPVKGYFNYWQMPFVQYFHLMLLLFVIICSIVLGSSKKLHEFLLPFLFSNQLISLN